MVDDLVLSSHRQVLVEIVVEGEQVFLCNLLPDFLFSQMLIDTNHLGPKSLFIGLQAI